jgi:hypothetical protein
MPSASPPNSDIAQRGRHFAFVPEPEVATQETVKSKSRPKVSPKYKWSQFRRPSTAKKAPILGSVLSYSSATLGRAVDVSPGIQTRAAHSLKRCICCRETCVPLCMVASQVNHLRPAKPSLRRTLLWRSTLESTSRHHTKLRGCDSALLGPTDVCALWRDRSGRECESLKFTGDMVRPGVPRSPSLNRNNPF